MVLRGSATLVLAGALALGCGGSAKSSGRGVSLRDTTDARSGGADRDAAADDGAAGAEGASDARDAAAASGQADADADATTSGAAGAGAGAIRGPNACVLGTSVIGGCVVE
jgi:hypothetical protein